MSTLKDIASRVGVSPATVSRALRGLPGISAARRTAIMEAALEFGYVRPPDEPRLAGVVVCVPDAVNYGLRNPFFSEVLRGLMTSVPAGTPLCLADTADTLGCGRDFGFRDCLFVVISPDDVPTDRFVSGHTILVDTVSPVLPFVTMDNEAAGRLVTQYLLMLGHQDIAFIGKRQTNTSQMRLRGYRAALQTSGIAPQEALEIETRGFTARDGADAALAVASQVTALVAFNDVMAVGAIRALAEAGVSVPEQVSVVGFDDADMAAYSRPGLTTIHQPAFEEGLAVGALISRMLDGHEVGVESSLTLMGHLVVRESCQPCLVTQSRQLRVAAPRN